MDNKENNNPMLSFDKLREGLGIEGELPQVNEPERPKTVDEVKPVSKNVTTTGGKSVVENGIKFIDITEQYASPQQQDDKIVDAPVKQEVKVEQVVTPVSETPKKRVRTFNEIFSDFFSVFLPSIILPLCAVLKLLLKSKEASLRVTGLWISVSILLKGMCSAVIPGM